MRSFLRWTHFRDEKVERSTFECHIGVAPFVLDIFFISQNSQQKNPCGHLLSNKPGNNNLSEVPATYVGSSCASNQIVLPQDEAIILNDDPLLSASSVAFPRMHKESESDLDDDYGLQCKWEGCWEKYQTQKLLVKHIEKAHMEMKKGTSGHYRFFIDD